MFQFPSHPFFSPAFIFSPASSRLTSHKTPPSHTPRSRAESDSAVRKRFKALGIVNNLDVANLNPLMEPFNGKPVLTTKSGSLERGIREVGRGDGGGYLGADGDIG